MKDEPIAANDPHGSMIHNHRFNLIRDDRVGGNVGVKATPPTSCGDSDYAFAALSSIYGHFLHSAQLETHLSRESMGVVRLTMASVRETLGIVRLTLDVVRETMSIVRLTLAIVRESLSIVRLTLVIVRETMSGVSLTLVIVSKAATGVTVTMANGRKTMVDARTEIGSNLK